MLLLLCRPQHERVTILPVHHPDGLAGWAARGVRGGRRGHGRREEDRGHADRGHGRAGIALRDQGLRRDVGACRGRVDPTACGAVLQRRAAAPSSCRCNNTCLDGAVGSQICVFD